MIAKSAPMEPTSPGMGRPESGPDTDIAAGGVTEAVAHRPKIGVVRNPRSHRNRGSAAPDPVDPDLLIAAPIGREELAGTLARFAELGVELLVIDGGDGTMREVMSVGAAVFAENWPKLLVLPKGKTNALAIDLGMPGKWSLAEALRALPGARTIVRRPIRIDRQDAPGRQVLGFIMGTGAFTRAIGIGQVAHRFGAFQGLAVAAASLFAVLQALIGVGDSPWRAVSGMRFRIGGDAHDVPHSRHGSAERRYGSGLSTLHKFPLGMKPFADVAGGIRYLVVDAPLRRVVALLPAILMGFDRAFLPELGVHRGGADEMTLDLDGRFILDGEAFPPGSYRLCLGPELRFLVP